MTRTKSVNSEVIETMQRILPGDKQILLKSFRGGNKNYITGEHPVEKWKDVPGLTAEEIKKALSLNNWIDATIIFGRIVIDVDDNEELLTVEKGYHAAGIY